MIGPNIEQSTAEDVQTPPYEMLGPNYKCCYSSFINLGIQLNIAWRKNSIDLLCSEIELQKGQHTIYTEQQSFESIDAKHMENAW